jgi:hypothetical protein
MCFWFNVVIKITTWLLGCGTDWSDKIGSRFAGHSPYSKTVPRIRMEIMCKINLRYTGIYL